MDSKTFFDLVARMRNAQKEFIRTRSSSSLNVSRKLEKEIDKEIDRVRKILDNQKNPKIF